MPSKASRKRDALGAALLLLFGIVYLTGLTGGEQPPTSTELTVNVKIGEVRPVMPVMVEEPSGRPFPGVNR